MKNIDKRKWRNFHKALTTHLLFKLNGKKHFVPFRNKCQSKMWHELNSALRGMEFIEVEVGFNQLK